MTNWEGECALWGKLRGWAYNFCEWNCWLLLGQRKPVWNSHALRQKRLSFETVFDCIWHMSCVTKESPPTNNHPRYLSHKTATTMGGAGENWRRIRGGKSPEEQQAETAVWMESPQRDALHPRNSLPRKSDEICEIKCISQGRISKCVYVFVCSSLIQLIGAY